MEMNEGDAKMADSPEESSWTSYIQGFMCANDPDDNNTTCLSNSDHEFESPSLVSDAASAAVKKLTKTPIRTTMSKQTSFKKHKTTTKLMPPMGYDLEDTASSPVSSPRVSYMNDQFRDQKAEKAKMDVTEVKRNIFGKGGGDGVFEVENDTNYTALKKRTCG